MTASRVNLASRTKGNVERDSDCDSVIEVPPLPPPGGGGRGGAGFEAPAAGVAGVAGACLLKDV